jgi:uncharacterized protein with PQ loop repeat
MHVLSFILFLFVPSYGVERKIMKTVKAVAPPQMPEPLRRQPSMSKRASIITGAVVAKHVPAEKQEQAAATAAADAASAAANAAEVAAAAAGTAANAAASAHTAADDAASANTAADIAASAEAAASAVANANTAANAAVSAHTAANAAASAGAAATAAEVAAAAATNAANVAASANEAATDVAASDTTAGVVAKITAAATAAASAKTAASLKTVTRAAEVAAVAANAAANEAATASTAADAETSAKAAATAVVSAETAANAAASASKAASAAASATSAATAVAKANEVAKAVISSDPADSSLVNEVQPELVPPSNTWSTSEWYMRQGIQMLSTVTFAMIIKALCVAGNVLVQVSPFPQVKRWESRGCTGEADAAPYVSIAFGGCQWCFYGMFAWIVTSRSGFLILVHSNLLGAILGMYYVRTFFCHCRNAPARASLNLYLSAVTTLALLQVCSICMLPPERALFLTGLISSFCSVVGATSVLVTVPTVMKTKDSRSIPGAYAVANLCSSFVWSLCGYILDDPLVMIPNLFACCCSGSSLGLKVLYPSDFFPSSVDKLASVEEGIDPTVKQRKSRGITKRIVDAPTEVMPVMPIVPRSDAVNFQPSSETREEKPSVLVVPGLGVDGADGTGGTW